MATSESSATDSLADRGWSGDVVGGAVTAVLGLIHVFGLQVGGAVGFLLLLVVWPMIGFGSYRSRAVVIEAFILGLSTGTVCITSCAPSAVPLLVSRDWSFRRNAAGTGLYFAGRLVGYLVFGLVAGATGAFVQGYIGPRLEIQLSAIAYLLTGVLLLAEGLYCNAPKLRACRCMYRRYPWTGSLFGFGLLSGLHFCPPFFAAAMRVFSNDLGALGGAAFFLFFFLGTSLFFIPLLAVPFVNRRRVVRMIAQMSLLLMGVYFTFMLGVFRLGGVS